jgi:hypothetical protein
MSTETITRGYWRLSGKPWTTLRRKTCICRGNFDRELPCRPESGAAAQDDEIFVRGSMEMGGAGLHLRKMGELAALPTVS